MSLRVPVHIHNLTLLNPLRLELDQEPSVITCKQLLHGGHLVLHRLCFVCPAANADIRLYSHNPLLV